MRKINNHFQISRRGIKDTGLRCFVIFFALLFLSLFSPHPACAQYDTSKSEKIADTYCTIAEKHLDSRDYDAAIKWFNIAQSISPGFSRATQGLAQAQKAKEMTPDEGGSFSRQEAMIPSENKGPFLSSEMAGKTAQVKIISSPETSFFEGPYSGSSYQSAEEKWAEKFNQLKENYEKEAESPKVDAGGRCQFETGVQAHSLSLTRLS